MKHHTTMLIGGVLLLTISLSASAHNTKPEVIQLEVTSSGTLDMKTDSKCPATPKRPAYPEKGCVRAAKGEALSIQFKLSGNTSNSACPSPDKYQLNGIQIGGKNSLKPSSAQWDSPTKLLDEEVLADFVADPVTGWVNFTTQPNGDIVLHNNNGSKNGYFIWYRVRARCSNGSPATDIFYDPRMDNEGND
ncbi:MAG: hypothetical protein HKO64_01200 [Xanthomonadales bacterium]|nr:hypothetical protein [Xanthomonadales bacterium]NNL94215.1 hypothetical protein [Xanthomonadales bacterium]